MGYSKWVTHERMIDTREDPVCVLFISRNKDNAEVPGFNERRESFLTKNSNISILKKFREFVARGLTGEFCRCYISINERDEAKVRKMLLHELIDNENADLTHIRGHIVSIAAKKECAKGKKWMFDLDDESEELKNIILSDLTTNYGVIVEECERTPHGYYIIVAKGFDTREILSKYPALTLKRDDLKCIAWMTN